MNKILPILLIVAMPVLAGPVKDLKPVGDSEMTWLFWKLYDIQLFSADGRYQERRYPLALAIQYARDIESAMLVESTLEEWRRMAVTWSPEWEQQLLSIWPSVGAGDEIALRVDTDGASRFFYNQQLVGVIDDPKFAPAFLSIWLSVDTREPGIRRQLIGDPDA